MAIRCCQCKAELPPGAKKEWGYKLGANMYFCTYGCMRTKQAAINAKKSETMKRKAEEKKAREEKREMEEKMAQADATKEAPAMVLEDEMIRRLQEDLKKQRGEMADMQVELGKRNARIMELELAMEDTATVLNQRIKALEGQLEKAKELNQGAYDEAEKARRTEMDLQGEIHRRDYEIEQLKEQQEKLINLSDCKIAELENSLEDAHRDKQDMLARAVDAEKRGENAEKKLRRMMKLNEVLLDMLPAD